jgi:hypothetical protein
MKLDVSLECWFSVDMWFYHDGRHMFWENVSDSNNKHVTSAISRDRFNFKIKTYIVVITANLTKLTNLRKYDR